MLKLSSTTPLSRKSVFRTSTVRVRAYAMPGALNVRENVFNVFNRPLKQHGTKPPTGFFRTGFCETNETDVGNHAIAGIVTEDFLTFAAERGNDLRSIGLKEGCRWCLCVNRWKEAFDAYRRGEISKSAVPQVDLEATHQNALLSGVKMEELEQFASKEIF